MKDAKRHLLAISDLSKQTLLNLLDLAGTFMHGNGKLLKKVPLLRGKTVVNFFFESSTRTRTTFEIAARQLSADVLNFNVETAAVRKGETLLDTLKNLQAMGAEMFIVRHQDSGAANFIANNVAKHVCVINAGDGRHAHPTQALLDMYTIRKHKGDFSDLRVAIVGDILHSRVARSEIRALHTLGVKEIRLIAPRTLAPSAPNTFGAEVFENMEEGLSGVDVVIMLRLQKERMNGAFVPSEEEYYRRYGVTTKRLKCIAPDGIVMHPGPINRGVEVSSEVADGERSLILEQVTYGIAVRMAVISSAFGAAARLAKMTDDHSHPSSAAEHPGS